MSTQVFSSSKSAMFSKQPAESINQAAPVQNTYYTIADLRNARVYEISVNVEDANEDLILRVTINGEVLSSAGLTATHSTNYYGYIDTDAINRLELSQLTGTKRNQSYVCEGRSVKIEVRKTTATGAGNLTGVVSWGRLM